ncbi:hypothetical protein HQ35_06780 [Porphyromonas cangingivalis]|uniref:Uncharacterized protein n=2 Tax=Porphyromonas cangingivalis TaxID=36874 RepID=A0A0A2ELG9_PORCN|nr:hypothetical protein HQ35_06780 [Porphyromonas cangingivalis]
MPKSKAKSTTTPHYTHIHAIRQALDDGSLSESTYNEFVRPIRILRHSCQKAFGQATLNFNLNK